VEGGKGKAVAVEMGMGELFVQHGCAFESICTVTEELGEVQKDHV